MPVRDLRQHHDDWPAFCPIVERHGLLAVLGLPLVLDDRRVGSLNAYNTEPREWSDASISAGTVLADIAAAYILNAGELERSRRTSEQLQAALDSRIVIEQAKGKLSGSSTCHRTTPSKRSVGTPGATASRREPSPNRCSTEVSTQYGSS